MQKYTRRELPHKLVFFLPKTATRCLQWEQQQNKKAGSDAQEQEIRCVFRHVRSTDFFVRRARILPLWHSPAAHTSKSHGAISGHALQKSCNNKTSCAAKMQSCKGSSMDSLDTIAFLTLYFILQTLRARACSWAPTWTPLTSRRATTSTSSAGSRPAQGLTRSHGSTT